MNAKFLKKVFYNRKSRRGFKYPKRPVRRTNFNNIRRKINYNYTSRTQTYGPSSVSLNLTGNLNWDMSDIHFNFAEFVSTIVALDEYKKFADDYEYIKILGVGVTIYPNDEINNVPTYIDLDWGGQHMTENDILSSDRAKILYNDSKNKKTFYFRPPDVITHESFNPRKYNLISNFEFSSIYLSIQQDGGSLKGRVDIRISFRGPLTKLNQFHLTPKNTAVRCESENSKEIKKIEKEEKKESKTKKNKKEDSKFKTEFNGINLKGEYSVDSKVTNLSFLKGLIEEGVSEEKIRNSKNFKKLSEKNKKKIKNYLKLRNKKNVEAVKEKIKKEKEERKINKKNKRKKNGDKINFKKNDDSNSKKNDESEDYKEMYNNLLKDIEEEKKINKQNSFLNAMANERERIFTKYFNLKEELDRNQKELNDYENCVKDVEDPKEVEKINKILEIKKKNISNIEKKLEESDNEIGQFQKKAGVSDDEDD
jgi:hypothetical protein